MGSAAQCCLATADATGAQPLKRALGRKRKYVNFPQLDIIFGHYCKCNVVILFWSQMPINTSNALTLARQVRTYTLQAAGFTDTVDVLYVAQLMQKFMDYVTELREVSKNWTLPLCIHIVYTVCSVFVSLHVCVLVWPSCQKWWWKWAVTWYR